MFISIDTYKVQDKIKKIIDDSGGEKKASDERNILKIIKPIKYKPLDKSFLNKLIGYLTKGDKNWNPNYLYTPSFFEDSWKSFMDFFTRKLTDKKSKEIQKNLSKFVFPCECFLEATGTMKDTKKILRLKKNHKNSVVSDLKKIGIEIDHYSYIDMKLFLTFYHRIHSPISGTITDILAIEGNDELFGKNSIWIIKFETSKSPIYMMLIGESAIQDFNFLIEKGTKIGVFDPIGYFNWSEYSTRPGSQTVILYDPKDFNIKAKEDKNYFVGDSLI
jgi:hypothetical protein